MKSVNVIRNMVMLLIVPLVLTGCLGGLFGPGEAQVKGTVLMDGSPLVDALVTLNSKEQTTNEQGAFSFGTVENGTYTLRVFIDDDEVHKEPVRVSGNDLNLKINILGAPTYDGTIGDAQTVEDLGFVVGDGNWTIEEAAGTKWIQGAAGGVSYAYLQIPELADADVVTVEYTGMYTSEGNTWGLSFLSNDPDESIGTNLMILSAWDGLHLRKYNAGAAGEDELFQDEKVQPNQEFTLRITYDRANETIDLVLDGARPGGYPKSNIPADWLISGDEHDLIKLFINDTTALWRDIKVWVE